MLIVQHLSSTYNLLAMIQIPGNIVVNKINTISTLSQNLNSVGAWTDGIQVNKDNFMYSYHSIILVKSVVNLY